MSKITQKEIDFISFKNRLKNVYRTGWLQLGIPENECESVYSHIASTKDLVSEYNKIYNLELDIDKINRMITIKELIKAFTQEEKSVIQGNNKKDDRKIILAIQSMFELDSEFVSLYDEYIKQESKEAIYALMFSKFESDLQAVNYYERGLLSLEAVYEDIEYYSEDLKSAAKTLLDKYKVAPLAWLTYDHQYYQGNELFTELSNSLIIYCINKYAVINEDEKKL